MKEYSRYIIYAVLFTIVIGAFIYLGNKDFGKVNKMNDHEKFNMEYPEIPKDNMFFYASSKEVVEMLNETGTHIIYIGFSSNKWSQSYVKYLYEVLKENKIDKVYYYDILKDRSRRSRNYSVIREKLDKYVVNLDDGTSDLYTPMLIVVTDGQITFYNNDGAITYDGTTPETYWTESKISSFKNNIAMNIRGIYGKN